MTDISVVFPDLVAVLIAFTSTGLTLGVVLRRYRSIRLPSLLVLAAALGFDVLATVGEIATFLEGNLRYLFGGVSVFILAVFFANLHAPDSLPRTMIISTNLLLLGGIVMSFYVYLLLPEVPLFFPLFFATIVFNGFFFLFVIGSQYRKKSANPRHRMQFAVMLVGILLNNLLPIFVYTPLYALLGGEPTVFFGILTIILSLGNVFIALGYILGGSLVFLIPQRLYGLLVVDNSGQKLFEYRFEANAQLGDFDLFSGGFFAVGMIFKETLPTQSSVAEVKLGDLSVIAARDQKEKFTALLIVDYASQFLKGVLEQFSKAFGDEYRGVLEAWDGERLRFKAFEAKTREIFGLK
ncbi:MAG: hypothetical protein JW839_08640 [Candidatus Lokiarchaeota archaeon]|nr:hypothetical protein [Candidatus Lokiarchaeota archaeon]